MLWTERQARRGYSVRHIPNDLPFQRDATLEETRGFNFTSISASTSTTSVSERSVLEPLTWRADLAGHAESFEPMHESIHML